MRTSFAFLALATGSLFSFVSAASPIVAQYWAAYGGQSPSNVDWKSGDIAYYFVTITTSTGFEIPEGQSISDLQEFVSTTKAKGARPVFSVGGWSGSLHFSNLVETDAKRQAFAKELADFMDKYGFVGIDLDWEYPNGAGIGCNAISSQDSANFVLFLKELRQVVGSKNLLTAAVSVNGINGPDGSALSSFSEYGSLLDYINLMTYDISGSFSPITGPNAPLRTCKSDTSVQDAVALWTNRGFPAERILLGIPAYAVSFTTDSSTLAKTEIGSYSSQIYQEWTKQTPMGAPGDSNAAYTDVCGTTSSGYSGQWQFNELISNGLLSEDGLTGMGGYERIFDQCSQTPFLFNSAKKQMIVYDDAKSAGLKAAFARSQGLGGVMIFDTRGFAGTDVVSSIRENLRASRSGPTSLNSSMSDYHGNGGGYGGGYGGGRGYGGGNGYNGGGYNGGGGGGGYGRKRGRDDEYSGDANGNFRRRHNERGDYGSSPGQGPRRSYGGPGGGYGSPGNYERGMGHQQSSVAMQNKFKDSVWKLGNEPDYHPSEDLPRIAEGVETWFFRDRALVFLTFRAAVSELPHKLHHYAALLAHLSLKSVSPPVSLASRISGPASYEGRSQSSTPLVPGLPSKPVETDPDAPPAEPEEKMATEDGADDKPEAEKVNVGKAIVEDLMKAFQAFLDERKWRSVRYCVTLFAQLTALPTHAPLVAVSSLMTLLTSFLSVLDEPGLRAARGDECVRIIVEALLRTDGSDAESSGVETLKTGVQNYMAGRRIEKDVFADEETKAQWVDSLDNLVTSLSSTSEDNLSVSSILLPPSLPSLAPTSETSEAVEPLYLPMVLVPPELDDTDLTLTSLAGGGEKAIPAPPTSAGLRGDEGVGYEGTRLTLRLFDDETVPSAFDQAGNTLRSLIADVVNLYEVNRKEAAQVLLELPRWIKEGTFKSPTKPKRDEDDDMAPEEEQQGPGWSLENLIVETIFNCILAVPAPQHPLAYYHSLLTELCRLSPQTIAPSLGKSVRKLYASLGNDDGEGGKVGSPVLDSAGIKRFADWFSVHLSNFGFMWGWGDWAPDMEVSDKHPKRVFVKRVIELEVRLSYYDRIKGTIPEAMLETAVMADDAPGPEYAYEDSDHTHSAAAASFLRLVRSKASVGEAEEELASFQKSLESEHSMSEEAAEKVKRDLAVQTILNVGSRSFSHFLNALERYLVLLRNLASTAEKKQDLLHAVATFWRRNGQFHLIVLDKLLQYRLIDPTDAIEWVFAPQADGEKRKTWADLDLWQVVAIVLRTLESRTNAGRGRVEGLKREEEVREAEKTSQQQQQGEGQTGDENGDGDTKIADASGPTSNPEIESAIAYLSELEQDQNQVLVQVVEKFVQLLPEDVDRDDWEVWWIEGWFREFCRAGLPPRVYSRPALAEALASLEIPSKSVVRTVLDATRNWSEFA
ncbi:hypothetical protein JCM10212_004764 [Sporobolomyces blumeae]